MVKYRSPEKGLEEIEYIVRSLKKERLYIVDDYFLLNKKRLEKILDGIIENRLPVKWTCQSRVDGIDEDVIVILHYGAQLANQMGLLGLPHLCELLNS